MNQAPEHDKETARIEAFSDGVLAIIITLLVFGIQVPTQDQVASVGLLQALIDQWAMYLAFSASFFLVLVMWINHHRLFTVIRRSDNNLMLFNGLLLFSISLLPYPTAVVAQYLQHSEQSIAVIVYNAWSLVIAICFNLLWRYASHNNRLFSSKTDPALVAFISKQYAYGPFLYLGIIAIAFVSPLLSLIGNIALGVFFALPNTSIEQLIEEQE